MTGVPRYTASERRRWKNELERSAISTLVEHLRQAGDKVEICADRPEEASGGLRDVDFELSYNRRSVGVEIIQLIPGARSLYEVSAIQRHLQRELGHIPEERQLGSVIANIGFGPLPGRRAIDDDVSSLIAVLRPQLEAWPYDVGELRVSALGANGTFSAVRLVRHASSENCLVFLTSAREWGGAIRPLAETFLQNLLETKPAQTARWAEAWILIQDRTGLVAWDDLLELLPDRHARIPSNWQRIYVLPAATGVRIVDILHPPQWSSAG